MAGYAFKECVAENCKYLNNPFCECPDSPEGCQGCITHNNQKACFHKTEHLRNDGRCDPANCLQLCPKKQDAWRLRMNVRNLKDEYKRRRIR